MAEDFAQAFSQYWIIIVTVGGGVLAGAFFVYKISADFNRVMTLVRERLATVETKIDMLIDCNRKDK